jgi:cytochrome c oxidase assembly protein subunit 15
MFSKNYIRLNKITLILIFLVIIAGSVVRTSGSGMGCPDWPKCFGQVVPPTSVDQLPDDYLETYLNKRLKKVDRFSSLLEKIGLSEIAKELRDDETILQEEPFNARKTWIEYINRIFGVLTGFGVAAVLFWTVIKYRRKGVMGLAFANAVILIFQAWFGSIVVATNLVPWTITLHMLLAVLMIMLQMKIIFKIQNKVGVKFSKSFKYVTGFIFLICFIQMLLGSQVRQEFDQFYLDGVKKVSWLDMVSVKFFIHRSFSWVVLVLIAWQFWLNKKLNYGLKSSKFLLIILIAELISGVVLAYVEMPALVQTLHLVLACLIFATAYNQFMYTKMKVVDRL